VPSGPKLTDKELGAIFALHRVGKSNRAIAKHIQRSEKAVRTALSNTYTPKVKKKVGRKTKVKASLVRYIFRLACVKQFSSRKIAHEIGNKVSKSTILKILRSTKLAKYIKRRPTPHLKKEHKSRRLSFAKEYINIPAFWERVIFSDEKKFNLDGPDGCQYYWHDLRREPEAYSKRVSGGGSVMLWGAICANGRSKLVFLEGKQNSAKYVETLQQSLFPFLQEMRDKYGIQEPIFQQDGASIHTSRATKAFIEDANIKTMPWPAKSPDLNVIENVWGVLARSVYENGRQFGSRAELVDQIQISWNQIKPSYLKSLVDDMPTRLVEVILKRGGSIDR